MERKTPVVPEEDIRRQKEYCAELRALNAQRRQVPLWTLTAANKTKRIPSCSGVCSPRWGMR